jgi:transposase
LRYKRLEHGVFLWPSNVEPGGALMLTSAQLSMLIDGVDWRALECRRPKWIWSLTTVAVRPERE